MEEARHEADARTDEQRRREREERERRQRLAGNRAALSDKALASLKHRAEAALAADEVPVAPYAYGPQVISVVRRAAQRDAYLPWHLWAGDFHPHA